MVSPLKGRDYDAAELGVLFREARSLCHASSESYDLRYCKRDCNKVAHALAPEFVSVLVNTDMVHQV